MKNNLIVGLLFSVIVFPLATLFCSFSNLSVPYIDGILSELGASLNDYPLMEMEFKESCSDSEYMLNLYTWAGSYEGCTCANVSYYEYEQLDKHIVFQGLCNKNQTENKCENISEVPPYSFYNWSSGVFCAKKFENETKNSTDIGNYSVLINNSVLENENCKENFKKCGKLDDVGNYLCLPQDEECPINDIVISEEKVSKSGYHCTEIGEKYICYTNKATDKPVITKLKVTEGKLCADKSYYYTLFPQFILDKDFEKYGCKNKIMTNYEDEEINVLDRKSKDEFFKDSEIFIDKIYPENAEYPLQSLSAEMILYSKNYIGYNKTCLKENGQDLNFRLFNNDSITEMVRGIEVSQNSMQIIMWFSIMAIIAELLTCFLIFFGGFDELFNFCCWAGITFFFYMAINIRAIMALLFISKASIIPECGNAVINDKIKFYNASYNDLYNGSIIIVVIINLQLSTYVLLVVFKLLRCGEESCQREDPPKEEEKKVENPALLVPTPPKLLKPMKRGKSKSRHKKREKKTESLLNGENKSDDDDEDEEEPELIIKPKTILTTLMKNNEQTLVVKDTEKPKEEKVKKPYTNI